jgi:hypothetical protein
VTQLKESFVNALEILVNKLGNIQYCVRGTASLVLQGIDMNVDDIDVLCDEKTALLVNDLLKEYLVEVISYKESDKFKSYFGKFNIDGVLVEFMGHWQIKDKYGNWSKVYDGSVYNTVSVNDFVVKVTKIEDELTMFLAMGRFNAYQKIKKQLQSKDVIDIVQPELF